MHYRILISVWIYGTLLSCSESRSGISIDTKAPNIVIIFTDDQGYNDLGCFGSPDILTPNIDQLSKEGTLLHRFYTAQPVCTASRASLLTGCYPNRIGLHGALMPQSKIGINENELTMAEMLHKIGYRTAIFGKWHLGNGDKFNPLAHGFDEYFGIPYSNDMWPLHPWQDSIFHFPPLPLYDGYSIVDTLTDQSLLTSRITEKAVSFIKRNKENPFFLYVPHPQPHVPLFVSDRFKGKSERGLYGDVIMEIDWSVGEIIHALRNEGIDKNTLVIFASDNGPWLSYGTHSGSAYPLKEGKGTNWEGGVRVPCVIYQPGTIPAGQVLETPVMTIDLLPTIAGLTGAWLPEYPIDGMDVWPILMGKESNNPHEAYYFYYHTNQLQAIISGHYKLVLPHTYRTLSGRQGGKNGNPVPYDHVRIPKAQLFDLEKDPEEQYDISHLFPDKIKELMIFVESMRDELGDELSGEKGRANREPGRQDE